MSERLSPASEQACETPMSDHVAEFWRLIATEHVRILIDIRRAHDAAAGNPLYHWDSSSFPDDVAKALVADRASLQPATPTAGLEIAKAAGLKTCLDDRALLIIRELYKAVNELGNASPCLLAMVGSWGDTLDDADILDGLKRYNEMGECFIPDVTATGGDAVAGDAKARDREAVAKIIDPECAAALISEREWCEKWGKDFNAFAQGYIQRWDGTLAKADTILTALRSPDVAGDVQAARASEPGDLLPCPLCQSTKVPPGVCYVDGSSTREDAVRCFDCGCRATKRAWQSRSLAQPSPLPQIVQRALDVWSSDQYRSVMLPGLGARTCGKLAEALAAVLPIPSTKSEPVYSVGGDGTFDGSDNEPVSMNEATIPGHEADRVGK